MADTISTTPVSSLRPSVSAPARVPNRLRKRKRNKSPLHLGIKIKRISQHEQVSNHSRGTLGGFLSLNDLEGAGSDDVSLEKVKPKEKVCCLTNLTKRIGLGVYVQARGMASSLKVQEVDEQLEPYMDERETWYMFYPPPPSPSLAFEPAKWDSTSSLDSASNINYKAGDEMDDGLCHSSASRDSLHVLSQADPHHATVPNSMADEQPADIKSLILSAEQLAEQYRELIVFRDPTPVPPLSHPSPTYQSPTTSSFQLPDSFAVTAPRKIRKVKAQDSLRSLLDVPGSIDTPISPSSPKTAFSIASTVSSLQPLVQAAAEPKVTKAKTSPKTRPKQAQPPSPPPRESSLRQGNKSTTRHTNPLDDFEFHFVREEEKDQWPLTPTIEPLRLKRPPRTATGQLLPPVPWSAGTSPLQSKLWFPFSMPHEQAADNLLDSEEVAKIGYSRYDDGSGWL